MLTISEIVCRRCFLADLFPDPSSPGTPDVHALSRTPTTEHFSPLVSRLTSQCASGYSLHNVDKYRFNPDSGYKAVQRVETAGSRALYEIKLYDRSPWVVSLLNSVSPTYLV
ncbi:hypothetical protein DACRYDRAFT_20971 [Dacryopinax primogenitus]|uniref:Uncharacterized protein n=1 Tax=Dacryopinax primogenitus (strain DJM 731) TaxID=1858805 RepID=M5G2J7_DACPD|nr:uncharacterized protein DACRYDRAFT_20971 [Dacryopinax primogenitus]EJU04446.1 hypothetical protein DACRYDRAFT_20971 [Dacryopinax primogenitus]